MSDGPRRKISISVPQRSRLPATPRIGGPRIEYEPRDLPKKDFLKERIGKHQRQRSRAVAREFKEMRDLRGWPAKPKSASRRIHGQRAAQRYLDRKTPWGKVAKEVVKRGGKGLAKATGKMGLGVAAYTAAYAAAPKLGIPEKALDAADWLATGAAFVSKKGLKTAGRGLRAAVRRSPQAALYGGMAVASHKAGGELGKRHGAARAHQQRTQLHAGEYTKAKTWKATRNAAFRSGIARPGGKAMTLDEAGEILKRVRKK